MGAGQAGTTNYVFGHPHLPPVPHHLADNDDNLVALGRLQQARFVPAYLVEDWRH